MAPVDIPLILFLHYCNMSEAPKINRWSKHLPLIGQMFNKFKVTTTAAMDQVIVIESTPSSPGSDISPYATTNFDDSDIDPKVHIGLTDDIGHKTD